MTEWFAPQRYAAVYLIKIGCGCVLLWFGLRAAGIDNPVWALISLVLVVEPQWAAATLNVRARVLNTLLGCTVAALAAWLFGSGFAALLASTLAATAFAMVVRGFPGNWRLAPATALILSAAAIHERVMSREFELVGLRACEVLAGSGMALLMAWVYGSLQRSAAATSDRRD